jgi:BCD family chlorophyll transporter-like MFS transporter
MGKVFGGALLDLGQGLQQAMAWGDSAYPPFALVLLVESGIAVAALFALSRVNVHQFREDTGRSLSKVLSLELG